MRLKRSAVRVSLLAAALLVLAPASYAQVLPGAAEGSRVRPDERIRIRIFIEELDQTC